MIKDHDKLASIFNKIPDELYIKMLETHVNNFIEKKRDFEQDIPKLDKDFTERLSKKIQDGTIPLDQRIIQDRKRETTVALADPLEIQSQEHTGDYDLETGVIKISAFVPEDKRQHVYNHERLHALSGRTILAETAQFDEEDVIYHELRSGTRFKTPNERFRWLNEARIEELTSELEGAKDSNYYKKERHLLNLLLANNTTLKDTLDRAIFENYKPEDKPTVPAWKEFMQEINSAYGAGFLVRLDKLIQEQGIDRAIDIFESDREGI